MGDGDMRRRDDGAAGVDDGIGNGGGCLSDTPRDAKNAKQRTANPLACAVR